MNIKQEVTQCMEEILQEDLTKYEFAGEINRTLLGEDAAYDCDVQDPDDGSTPEWVWDLAHDVATHWEETIRFFKKRRGSP